MIKTEPYGGGVRWHCTDCDKGQMFGGTVASIQWTNGKPPEVCPKCDPHKEYRIKLDFSVLLPYRNSALVREAIEKAKGDLAGAIRICLDSRDTKLNSCTARPLRIGLDYKRDGTRHQTPPH